MIGLGIAKVLGLLGRIPWQIYAAIALLLAVGLSYCHGHSTGYEEADAKWQARLEKAEADAKAKAEKAAKSADKAQQQRTDEFEAEQDTLTKEIEDANRSGDNALDAVLRSLR